MDDQTSIFIFELCGLNNGWQFPTGGGTQEGVRLVDGRLEDFFCHWAFMSCLLMFQETADEKIYVNSCFEVDQRRDWLQFQTYIHESSNIMTFVKKVEKNTVQQDSGTPFLQKKALYSLPDLHQLKPVWGKAGEQDR